MKPTKPVKDLLEKEMTRQEFLKVAGLGMLSIFGVGNVLSYIVTKPQKPNQQIASRAQDNAHGFGSRKFGV